MSGTAEEYFRVIRDAIGKPIETVSALDLCCGEMTMTRHLKFKRSLHTDIQDWPNRPIEFPFVQGDVFRVLAWFPDGGFDVALCMDGIEHFEQSDSIRLLFEMQRVARLSIIFTPIGSIWENRNNPPTPYGHKCGWMPEELMDMGWTTAVFPNWHEELGFGAFFAWKGEL